VRDEAQLLRVLPLEEHHAETVQHVLAPALVGGGPIVAENIIENSETVSRCERQARTVGYYLQIRRLCGATTIRRALVLAVVTSPA
jgi:hypothetical protein